MLAELVALTTVSITFLFFKFFFSNRFVLDAADLSAIPNAKAELHSLVEKESLKEIPILILANKNDLEQALTEEQVIEELDLASIKEHQVSCYSISVKEANNLNSVLSWLISKSK